MKPMKMKMLLDAVPVLRSLCVGGVLVLAAIATQAEQITFLDYDAESGTFTNAVCDCTPVTSETRTLTNGWYAVVDDVVLPEGANLTVSGSAHLILCDGASLTITNTGDYAAGICVVDANRLTIYGQEAGSGVLVAQGGKYGAGIGGVSNGSGTPEWDCGTVTINGGTVTATGGDSAAGIGCSPMGIGGHVVIHGGAVTAAGGTLGTGIGCRLYNIPPKDGSEVVITGGKVLATGGKDIYFANISISGGVFAHRPDVGWCAAHFGVFANPDPATNGDYPHAVLPSFTVTVGEHPHMTAAWTSGDGTKTNAFAGTSFVVSNGTENVAVVFAAAPDFALDGESEVWLGTVADDITFGAGNDYRVPEARYLLGDIPYLDWNGTQMTNAALPKYVFTFVTARTLELGSGWYAVTNDVVFEDTQLTVNGNAHLILCDGASLMITNAFSTLSADMSKCSLSIYGQSEGSGRLTVTGGSDAAVIAGTLTINGGTVTATGNYATGIAGTLTINDGTVTAQGGDNAAGIGGGYESAGRTMEINGGMVTAKGGRFGAGIGGGWKSYGGEVTINGGTVTATGGEKSAGIGGGEYSAGGTVTITGGRITAQGDDAGDIGGGYLPTATNLVEISGGIFARPVQDGWLLDGYSAITNQDATTVAAYPWAVVPYPAAWPAADDAVKAKFGPWRDGLGAGADLSTDAAQKAFLLNVATNGIKTLKIESIDVDAEGYASIVVSAPGAFFFDRVDLGNINGVLYVQAGDTLETMEPKSVSYWTTTNGKANITLKAHFIRAAIGFQTPEVPAD